MTVLVVFTGKALDVVLTVRDGALLGPLGLVSEHMGLQIFEESATVWVRAAPLLLGLVIAVDAAQSWALL